MELPKCGRPGLPKPEARRIAHVSNILRLRARTNHDSVARLASENTISSTTVRLQHVRARDFHAIAARLDSLFMCHV